MQNRTLRHGEIRDGRRLALIQGDLTVEKVDAIINAANSQLTHGGGVAGAIVRAGGDRIQRESARLAPVEVGKAVITTGGSLPASHVIHTVGPRWGEGDEDAKLRSAVQSALEVADEHSLKSVSMPAISTGIFGFPLQRAADIIMATVTGFLNRDNHTGLKEVRICLFDQRSVEVFQQLWAKQFPDA